MDNNFIQDHPRFAKANDVVTLRRILGLLRIAMYQTNPIASPVTDYYVDYGLCIVPGDYDDAGTWSVKTPVPTPSEASDEDDKWLFKATQIFSFGAVDTLTQFTPVDSGTLGFFSQPLIATPVAGLFTSQVRRPSLICTDQCLPNGSFIDLKTHRRLQFGEKLMLITEITGDADDNRTFYATNALRILTSKWG